LTEQTLEEGVSPDAILNQALVVAMNKVGQSYSKNKLFVPQMLLAAKAMVALKSS
jgi:5-methyltetrahydrofolate--homocysteine methyltransferase